MRTVAKRVFWSSAGGAAWVLAGHPAALAVLPARPTRAGGPPIAVSIVIPAFCEREGLRRKLQALREVDYPRELLQVIVAVDEDPELARIARSEWPGAEVLFSPERGGKAAGVNRAVRAAHGDAILLTDANNVLLPGSIRAAAEHLADPDVWGVAGSRGENGSQYARYEMVVRRLESRTGSVAAAPGEFMLVRRERMPVLPDDVVNDDLWLLCRLVGAGGRVVFAPRAASVEPSLPPGRELERRTRIAAGRVMLASELRRVPPGYALKLVSHNGGRLALGPFLAGILGSSIALARRRPIYRVAVAGQLAVYVPGLLALAGAPTPSGPLRPLASAGRELLVGCTGTTMGLLRGIAGRQDNVWRRVR
jgi:hypothetical protein